jgi:hypothetical protein
MSQLCWQCGQTIWDNTPHVCMPMIHAGNRDRDSFSILQQILQELKEIKEKLDE